MSYRKDQVNSRIRQLRKKTPLLLRPVFWISIFIVLLVGAGAYFALFFSKIQVSHIEISGNQKISNEQIQQIVEAGTVKQLVPFVSTKSILLINMDTIEQALLAKFPILESADIARILPDTLTVVVKERQVVADFCQDKICFSIDGNGVIFEPASIANLMVITKSTSDTDLTLGKNIIELNLMQSLLRIQKNLKDSAGVDIQEAFVSNPLIITTSERWQLYFDPSQDINLQILKMNSLLKETISIEDRKTLEYIKLQYKDRAYYK